jgi:methylmalonyl-CoA/ethylmalonyl-CoA epimerase
VGFAVRSIGEAGAGVAASLGAAWDGAVVHDPAQRARVAFIRPGTGGPAIELIEADAADAPLAAFVARGGGLHHLCYEVDSLEAQLASSRAGGALIVRRPVPAVAFEGRRIAWVYTKERLLIEYLER